MRPYTQYGSQQGQRSSQYSSHLSLASNATLTHAPTSRQTNTSTRASGRAYSTEQPSGYGTSIRQMSLDEIIARPAYSTSRTAHASSRQAAATSTSATRNHRTSSQSTSNSSSRSILANFPSPQRGASTSTTATPTSRGWTEPPANSYYQSYGGWPNYMHSHGLKPWDYGDAQEGRAVREGYRDVDRATWEREQRHQSSAHLSRSGSQYSRHSSIDARSDGGSRYSVHTPAWSNAPSSAYNHGGSSYNQQNWSYNYSPAPAHTSGRASTSTYHPGHTQTLVATVPSTQSVSGGSWSYRDTARYSCDSDDDDAATPSNGATAGSSSYSDSHDTDVHIAESGFASVEYISEDSSTASYEDDCAHDEFYDSPGGDEGAYDDREQCDDHDYDDQSDGGDYDDDDYDDYSD